MQGEEPVDEKEVGVLALSVPPRLLPGWAVPGSAVIDAPPRRRRAYLVAHLPLISPLNATARTPRERGNWAKERRGR